MMGMTGGDVEKWVVKALNDMKVAEHEMRLPDGEMTTDAVCFHCQQAAEKLLKAYLVSRGVDFGRTHELEFLLQLCIGQDAEFKEVELGNLSSYAVEIRYPDEFYIPSVEEARKSFALAGKLKEFVLKKLGLEKEKGG